MATINQAPIQEEMKPTNPSHDPEAQPTEDVEIEILDYSKRAQWLRAAVLGANDGLLSTASLMIGVGAVKKDVKTMILTGAAGLVAGACSMAIGEFVSVYTQYDIEMAQIRRDPVQLAGEAVEERKKGLPNPFSAAAASAVAFAAGAMVPLLAAAFIKGYRVRVAVVVAAASLALVGFGGLSAVLGRAPLVKSSLRILVGGWLAMAITFGLTKLIGSIGI
ncbi:vacuolar iron transporter homolog 3-like [Diospyros lotus]|uniref:vacuolar iron transporter homolog 3-like n=1 Tax=Diospyros lotus TaxID=55363 RepID=UPI002257029E|nr:vacuolar iron transporter homolog 3-like [Diospyros lotus]